MNHKKCNNIGSGVIIRYAIGTGIGILLTIATGHHTYIIIGIVISGCIDTTFENTEEGNGN